jgi:hypothetical protein
MRRSRWTAAAALLALACAHDYRDPDPASVPTALLVIENPWADLPEMSSAEAVVHVYETDPVCERTYLGTVSIAERERAIRLAADRSVSLELSLLEQGRYGTRSCDVAIAFVPKASADYRLILGDRFRERCTIELQTASGEPVRAYDPRQCRPDLGPPDDPAQVSTG